MKPVDRPALSRELSEDEFVRWYWTMAELQPFARSLDVRAAGPKAALIKRIGAALSGRAEPVSAAPPRAANEISGVLTLATEVPVGQRSTEALRAFFQSEIGPRFTFNGHMRAFLKGGGVTLADAVQHWHDTVGSPLPAQSKSLEFNAFTKAWHQAHPTGGASSCREAWDRYRSLPVDARPPIADA